MAAATRSRHSPSCGDDSAAAPLMRFFSPTALSGRDAISGRTTGRTDPASAFGFALAVFQHAPAGHAPWFLLSWRSATCGRIFATWQLHRACTFPFARVLRRPWGLPFAAFFPRDRLPERDMRSSYPACRWSSVAPSFLAGGSAVRQKLFREAARPACHPRSLTADHGPLTATSGISPVARSASRFPSLRVARCDATLGFDAPAVNEAV